MRTMRTSEKKAYVKLYKKALMESSPQQWLRKCYHSSKSKTRQCTVTLEYVQNLWDEQNGKCAISGLDMKYKNNDLMSASVDRIDSSKDYIEGNIQLTCQWVNLAKSNATNEEILQILKQYRDK